jgi:tetratricopeptide (TPR) repeat protein
MAAHRRGEYAEARESFDQALAYDSTFVLAALRGMRARQWLGSLGNTEFVWRNRARLVERDRLLLYAMLGRDAKEDFDNAEALLAVAPDDLEAWVQFGDHLFHYGSLAGWSDAHERSRRAFGRAMKLDSTFTPIYEHLYEIHYNLGDTAASLDALKLLLSGKPSNARPIPRWFAGMILGDSTIGIRSLTDDSLVANFRVAVRMALRHTRGLVEAESLLSLREGRVASYAERRELQECWWIFHVIRGRPTQALAHLPDPAEPVHRAGIILDALYADADMSAATRLLGGISQVYRRPTARSTWQSIVQQYARAQYSLAKGQPMSAKGAVEAWIGAGGAQDTSESLRLADHLALLLDAQVAALEHRSDALARLAELDSVLVTVPTYGGWIASGWTFGGFEPVANLIAGRLWEQRGEFARALAAARRRVEASFPTGIYIAQLRDEARYAALVGDQEGAAQAYRQYLTLRSDAEPSVQLKVQEVRAEFEALKDEPTDK